MRKHRKYEGVMPAYKTNVNKFEIIDRALVDNEQWYTVQVHPEIRPWMREQPSSLCYEHIDRRWYKVANTFDVHEKIYTMLAVKWS